MRRHTCPDCGTTRELSSAQLSRIRNGIRSGHEFTDLTLYVHPRRGTRECRLCRNAGMRRKRDATRQALEAA